jgi:hypothetical protein
MVRKVICVWLLVQLLTGCTAQEKKMVEFGGKVIWHTPKEVTYFTYKPDVLPDGTIEKGDYLMTHGHLIGFGHKRVFDREGRLTASYLYGEGDSTITKGSFFTYLTDNMVQFEEKIAPPYPETDDKEALNYSDYTLDSLDIEGKKLWQKEFWRLYDEQNNEMLFKENYIYTYTYDDKGTLIKETRDYFDIGDSPDFKTELENKTVIMYDVEYRDGRLYRYGRFPEYTETWYTMAMRGVEPGTEQRLKDKWPQYTLYFYDAEGNKIREETEGTSNYKEFYPNGIVKKAFYGEENYSINNEDGYVVKLLVDRPRPTSVYEAKYDQLDEHGNWTRVIVHKDGIPEMYGERTITYYE